MVVDGSEFGVRAMCRVVGARPDFLRGWEDYADDFRLELLDGVGHFLVDQEPALVASRLTEFLDS